MKAVLLGYGNMGKMIEALAPGEGIRVVGHVDRADEPLPTDFDVAIEFTEADAVVGNVARVAALGKPIVIGTTGWYDRLAEVEKIVDDACIGAIYSANFSIGVLLFLRMVEHAAALMKDYPAYEAFGYEAHHSAKKDAPSGTMLMALDSLRRGGFQSHVDVASTRAGRIPGTHTVGFDSQADSITLTHTARGREGFARGALLAAKLAPAQRGLVRLQDCL